MQKKKKILLFLLLSIIAVVSLTGCSGDADGEDIKSKVSQELDYLDTKIAGMLNKLNNISIQNYTITSEEVSLTEPKSSGSSGGNEQSGGGASSGQEGQGGSQGGSQEQGGSQGGGSQGQGSSQGGGSSQGSSKSNNVTAMQMEAKTILNSDQSDIDWNSIKTEVEILDEAWGVILLDLASLNVNNDDVLNFSATLNDCILSIKDEDKEKSLSNLAKLYSFIPKYETSISAANDKQIIKQTKSHIVNAYSVIEKDDWNGAKNSLSQAEETFKSITNDIDYIKNNEFKVNKTYVLLKELQNSLSREDKKLFYIKYRNLIESVNML